MQSESDKKAEVPLTCGHNQENQRHWKMEEESHIKKERLDRRVLKASKIVKLHYWMEKSTIKDISLKSSSKRYRSRRASNIVYSEYRHSYSKDLNRNWKEILQLCYSIINISLQHSSQCSLRGGLIGLPSHSSHCSITHFTFSLLWIILAYPLGLYRSLISFICCPILTAWLFISLLLPTFYGSPGLTKLA